jgi:hypothetical protein
MAYIFPRMTEISLKVFTNTLWDHSKEDPNLLFVTEPKSHTTAGS